MELELSEETLEPDSGKQYVPEIDTKVTEIE